MRILDTIYHPKMYIGILYMNEKFILKFEIGPYEQIYKFTKDMAADVEAVKKICDLPFQENVMALFDQMHEGFKKKFS
jgi:hypothetical protein